MEQNGWCLICKETSDFPLRYRNEIDSESNQAGIGE
jgi:hypothetical protein